MKENKGDAEQGEPFSKTAGDAGLETGYETNSGTDSETGLPWLKTWKAAYIFVVCSFILWLVLLISLTELSA